MSTSEACMFCRTQGDRTDLAASPCGGPYCAFHVKCANNFIRTIPDAHSTAFVCPECQKAIPFSVSMPSNFEIVHRARESIGNFCLALMTWKFLALYVAFQALATMFFLVAHVAFLIAHHGSWIIWALKAISYLFEWVPPPESVKALPRVPLFMPEPWVRPYSPEMSEVVDFERSVVSLLVHFLALGSYGIAALEQGHAKSLFWIGVDTVLFCYWGWRLTLNILEHWRRLTADVLITGIGTSPA